MKDLIIGIVVTLLSTTIVALWSILIVNPYQAQRKIYKYLLRFARNFEDPRKFEGHLVSNSLMIKCIEKQINLIEEIQDLIEEQKDLNKFIYWLFNYEETMSNLNFIFEYIRNPIMLKEQKEFDDDYILDTEKFLKRLKQKAKLPVVKVILLFLLPTISLSIIFAITVYLIK